MDEDIKRLTTWDPVMARESGGVDLVVRRIVDRARNDDIEDREFHANAVAVRLSQVPVMDASALAATLSAFVEGGANPTRAVVTKFFDAVLEVLSDAYRLLVMVPPKTHDPAASARESSTRETMLRARAAMSDAQALRQVWAWEAVDEWCGYALPLIVACASDDVTIPHEDDLADIAQKLADHHLGARAIEAALMLVQSVAHHRRKHTLVPVVIVADAPSQN